MASAVGDKVNTKPKKGGKGQAKGKGKGKGGGKETGLKLKYKKEESFSDWYTEIIVAAEMIDYYDVGGCYILRPWSYAIWEKIQRYMDDKIKEFGVQNAYFPMFVKRAALEAEADHVEGFAPEVAWVTKSGESDLAEPIAVRPTSETIMYPAYAKWINSHRDLPLRLNQWCNVIRWEFKSPTPFLRTREFLWQEGHSAFATKEEADAEVIQIIDMYASTYEHVLAVPVIKGRKSEKEKFAGGLYTTTCEALIPTNGRAIQACTSHCLGQGFAKMFDIKYESDAKGTTERPYVWQNSWGFTTRAVGVMVMVHGDDKGLVLPPRVAPLQVVIVYILKSSDTKELADAIKGAAELVYKELKGAGIRVKLDDRDNYNPGWKYNYWEQRGVPLRIEIGPMDLANKSVMVARRDNGKKASLPMAGLAGALNTLMDTVQGDMLAKARKQRDSQVDVITKWEDFVPSMNQKNICLLPWCERIPCEDKVKDLTSAKTNDGATDSKEGEDPATKLTGAAKTLCIPFNQAPLPAGTKCIVPGCEHDAVSWTLFGRSY